MLVLARKTEPLSPHDFSLSEPVIEPDEPDGNPSAEVPEEAEGDEREPRAGGSNPRQKRRRAVMGDKEHDIPCENCKKGNKKCYFEAGGSAACFTCFKTSRDAITRK